jgi:outer membrane lipoprotein-sorting protein
VESLHAENAKEILDKAAARFKSAGNIKADFVLAVNGNDMNGTLYVSGKKFKCSTDAVTSWFDGKTMWHYVAANDEVNVTNPSAAEIARMNPYSFLSLYKNGYKCEMGKSSANEYEVILTGQKGSTFSHISVRINKKSYQPSYIKTTGSKAVTEISVKSLKKNQKFSDSIFKFNKNKYPNVEIVDLR